VRRVVPRRIDHRIQFDRIHTFEHRPSEASPALLRHNAAWNAGGGSACPSSMGFSIDGCNVCEARISPRFLMKQIASLLSPGRAAALLVMARDFADKSAARQWVWDRLVLRA
jgi:hypothetical protein